MANNGCAIDTFSIDITVYPAPDISFDAPLYACADDSVQFTNTSLDDVTGFFWEFGDGATSSETSPVHFYETPGAYWVKMTAYAVGTGCPNTDSLLVNIRSLPQPNLQVDSLFGCPPHTVVLDNLTVDGVFCKWDFGDGNTSVDCNPGTHVYTESGVYQITLWAVDVFGCDNDTVFSEVVVYPVPNASFDIFQTTLCGIPQNICLDNTSTGADGFFWNFGNGTNSTQNNPCTSYDAEGRYSIRLTAKNIYGCTDTTSRTFTAYEAPAAIFAVDTLGCAGYTPDFQNLSENADSVLWIITAVSTGDALRIYGNQNSNWEPDIELLDTGYYNIKLIAWNGSGCADTMERLNNIRVLLSPTANFAYDKLENELPQTYQFTDSSSVDVVGYSWDFDDGNFADEMNPIHRYLSIYDKLVVLWVVNEYGCADSATALVDLDVLNGLYVPNILEPAKTEFEEQVFKPKGIGLEEYHIAVYSRSGQLVWESTAIDQDGMPVGFWDGTLFGEELPAGVYVWKVFKTKFLNGTIWDGMPDENGIPRKSNFLYLIR